MNRMPEEIAVWTPSLEELSKWEPLPNEFVYGNTLMCIEDYSAATRHFGKNITFDSLVYCILSARERFSRHTDQFNDYLVNVFSMEDGQDSSLAAIANEDKVKAALKNYGFHNRKGNAVLSAAHAWEELDMTRRLREDSTKKEKGFEFREEMVDAMEGVGYKFTSLSLRMCGYHELVTLDVWATKFLESKGVTGRNPTSGFKRKSYLQYENEMKVFSDKAHVSPALYQATVYAMCSSWLKDSNAFGGFEKKSK